MFNINGINWDVIQVHPDHPSLSRSDGSYALGVCDNTNKVIYLNNSLSKRKTQKVLCHEITHAAMFSYGINLTYDQEELVADLIATYGAEIINITNRIFNRIAK